MVQVYAQFVDLHIIRVDRHALARISHRRPDQGRNPLPELRKRK
jgi:hypothetical protein